jgi:hypothetical protein
VLKALVSGEDTRRTVILDELLSRLLSAGESLEEEALRHSLLPRLVQARLVRASEVEGRTRYELTHEFLITHSAAWIADRERERTKVLELIARAYEVYQTTGLLLSPEALAIIEPWEEELVLPEEQRAFLALSRQQARRKWRGLLFRVGAVVLAVMLLAGGAVGWWWQQDLQRRLAASYVVQGTQELLEGRTQRATVYLSEAYARGETAPALRMVLKWALRSVDTQRAVFRGHSDWLSSASFNPDGRRLMTASHDKTVHVWEIPLETRSPAEVTALVQCHVPWRLTVGGQLLQVAPNHVACPPRAAAR